MKLKLFFCFLTLFINYNIYAVPGKSARVKDGNGTLSGLVTDKATGITIPGATVSIPDLRTGTVTDANGKYLISNLPKGVYLVQISFVGYATFNQRVDLSKISVLNVQLKIDLMLLLKSYSGIQKI